MKYIIVYHGECCKTLKIPHRASESTAVNGFKKAINVAYVLANKHNKTMYILKNDKTVAVLSPRETSFSKFTADSYIQIPVSKYIAGEKNV